MSSDLWECALLEPQPEDDVADHDGLVPRGVVGGQRHARVVGAVVVVRRVSDLAAIHNPHCGAVLGPNSIENNLA